MTAQPLHRPWPSIAPAARDYMATVILRAGGRECAFATTWSTDRQRITAARLVARGNRSEVIAVDLLPGDLAVHNHPGIAAEDLEPSSSDLDMASHLAAKGRGYGIITDDATALYLVAEPPPPRLKPGRSCRTFELGRFAVTFWWRWQGAEAEG